jgi:hypothetical protein
MTQPETTAAPTTSVEEIQKGWHELKLRVAQLEAGRGALAQEDKALRYLLERAIEHRQKSHSELVLILTNLVSKLPLNELGVILSKLVEHNTNVNQVLAALVKGTAEADMPQPVLLKTLELSRRDLVAALKQTIEELTRLEVPLENELLQLLGDQPELFFSPRMVRANRCFIKGQVPRERIIREFGEPALIFFKDMTTDPKLNPRPKPEEIVLAFHPDFDQLFEQHPALIPQNRQALRALHQRIQRSKAPTDQARSQKNAFQKLSFVLELLHYYDNQNTEAPDVIFAHRLPVLIEQLVVTRPQEPLDEKFIAQAEALLVFIISPDHRLMVINNVGKSGGAGKTLKHVLRLRAGKAADLHEAAAEFIRHLIPPTPEKPPPLPALAALLRLVSPEIQRLLVRSIIAYDRIRKAEAEALGKALSAELGLQGIEEEVKTQAALPPEMERQLAWAKIEELLAERTDPATIAAAIRDRLNARYDAAEMRQSWITLTEADPMLLIRVVCQLPYRSDGRTDPIAKTTLETYVTRLTHEKYAATYHKIVNSLRNMFRAKPDSPTLLNFVALVRWSSPEAADKLCADVGMPLPAH